MRKLIPGEFQVIYPSKKEIFRLSRFSPFIRQAGDTVRKPWELKARKLLDFLLVHIGSGHGRFSVGDETFSVEKNDFIWIPPNTIHEMSGDSPQMRCTYIHFDLFFDKKRSFWDAYIPGGTIDLKEYAVLMHPKVEDLEIKQLQGKISSGANQKPRDLLRQICFEYKKLSKENSLFLSGLTLQLINELIKINNKGSVSKSLHWQLLEEAEEYIHDHLTTDLNVADLAKKFRLSDPHFRKIFRENFGISPSKMHRKLRIKKGCEYIVYSNMNISEAAFKLGFSTVHSFSKAFKEITGLSPTDYKKGKI